MPEGPECRHITDLLNQYLVDRSLVKVSILSGRYQRHGPFSGFELLHQHPWKIDKIQVKGKFIWWELSHQDQYLYIFNTLGMTGQWTGTRDKHARVEFQLHDDSCIYFRDIRNFGTLTCTTDHQRLQTKLQSLGIDILTETPRHLLSIFQTKPDWPITKFLMSQNYFCGIGNYLKAEGLHRAKLSPHLLVKDLTETQKLNLFQCLQDIAQASYQQKGASFQTYRDPDSNKGKYSFNFQVYGQKTFQGYPVIVEKTPDGRSTHWCPLSLNNTK